MSDPIDVSPYVSPTRFSGLAGVFLARAILRAAPSSRSERVQGALRKVREAGEVLRAVARERMRRSPRDLRPLDAQLDAGWVALRETIEARARLIGNPDAERAGELAATLFPNGTAFVRANYREQWAASQLHLERIEEESLASEIVALAGADFLPYIHQAHAAFGEALGVGEEVPDAGDTTALQRANAALGQAIADYGRVLAGDLDREDAASVAAFRKAMGPVDDQRAVSRRSRSASEEEPEVSEDVDLEEPMPAVERETQPLQPTG